jgi:hypothetical protein
VRKQKKEDTTMQQLQLAQPWQAWGGSRRLRGSKIGEASDNDGYTVEIYRAATGRITVRCYYWHHDQDASREGYLLDHRVSGQNLKVAQQRARECGYPLAALLSAVSETEDAIGKD